MLVYEMTEGKAAAVDKGPKESVTDALRRGARPAISPTNQCKDLITRLWTRGTGGKGVMKTVINYFEDPNNLLEDVNEAEFHRYKGWLDYGDANQPSPPSSQSFIKRVYRENVKLEAVVKAETSFAESVASLVSWLDSPGQGSVVNTRRDALLASLRAQSTFDPDAIFAAKERPPCVSLFTSAVQDLPETSVTTESGREGMATVYDCKFSPTSAPVRMKRLVVNSAHEVCPDDIIPFFRELVSQLYITHSAFHHALGWNIFAEASAVHFCLFSEKVESNGLTFPRIRSMTPTQKTILLYGVARGMAHLHSAKILHRALSLESILLDSQLHPRIGNLSSTKDAAEGVAQSLRIVFSFYQAPEMFNGEPLTFASDVYSYAMLCYEILEASRAELPGLKEAAARRAVVSGRRPAWKTKTSEPSLLALRELVGQMWGANPGDRPPFQDIAHILEDDNNWLPGTDAAAFFRYKGFLDASEKFAEGKSVVAPGWITRASALRGFQELQSLTRDMRSRYPVPFIYDGWIR
jgi:hypothetical protein